ncbi:MAG: hypothetical protein ACPGJS_15345 [Flammeovirgaceae bacterium]
MPRYMVTCIMHNQEAPSETLKNESQKHFLELMKEGYLLTAHINRAWVKCWLFMQAPEIHFIENLLKTSPLYDSMHSTIDELEE